MNKTKILVTIFIVLLLLVGCSDSQQGEADNNDEIFIEDIEWDKMEVLDKKILVYDILKGFNQHRITSEDLEVLIEEINDHIHKNLELGTLSKEELIIDFIGNKIAGGYSNETKSNEDINTLKNMIENEREAYEQLIKDIEEDVKRTETLNREINKRDTLGSNQNPSIAETSSKITNKELITKTGKVIKENLEGLRNLNDAQFQKSSDLTVIATINDMITLNEEEFLFTKKMHEAFEMDKNDNDILNILVEEKIQIAEAAKRSLLPTEEEVTDYIKMEQIFAEEDTEVFREIINGLGLTEDEYWNVYQRFYTPKILAFSKLQEAFYQEAGLKINEKANFELLEDRRKHYHQYLQELKNKAEVIISKEFENYSYDKTIVTVQ